MHQEMKHRKQSPCQAHQELGPPFPALAIPLAIFAIPLIALPCVRSSSTSRTLVPLPRATLHARLLRPIGMPFLSIFI
jgi:hypothetical protein